MVTMADVARAAGVSAMTVSNVINGRASVSADTRLRVLDAVAELGYQMNHAARHLRAGRTGAVGLVVPELDRPYYGQLATRLADGLERRGLHLVLERTGASREGELAAVSFARLRMYDGVVLSVVGLEVSDLERLNFDTPVVLIGERPVPERFDHVMMDNVGGAKLATAHLLASGARRIALVGGRDGDTEDMPTLRTKGYREAHAEAGVDVDQRLVRSAESFSMRGGRDAVLRLHADGVAFDAVFALTDATAIGVLRGLADLGLRVPADVQVIGFDDDEEAEFAVPTLTSVDPGNPAMTETIVRLLERRMMQAGSTTLERTEAVPPARLVLRGSTR
jgi:DNA-binding LacI/PurR family transcriptional regulator